MLQVNMRVKLGGMTITYFILLHLSLTAAGGDNSIVYLCQSYDGLTCFVGELSSMIDRLEYYCYADDQISSQITSTSEALHKALTSDNYKEAGSLLRPRNGNILNILASDCFLITNGGNMCDDGTEPTSYNFVYYRSHNENQCHCRIQGLYSSVRLERLNASDTFIVDNEVKKPTREVSLYDQVSDLQVNTDKDFLFIYVGDDEDTLSCGDFTTNSDGDKMQPMSSQTEKFSPESIAGIVIGSVVLIVLTALLIYLCLKRRSEGHYENNLNVSSALTDNPRSAAINHVYDYIIQGDVSRGPSVVQNINESDIKPRLYPQLPGGYTEYGGWPADDTASVCPLYDLANSPDTAYSMPKK